MADAALKNATYEDVLNAPQDRVAELVHGTLYVHSRPAGPHTVAATALGEELGPPFKRGRGGPGGWILLDEPEVHFGADVLVPDLAGWRLERLPTVTTAPYFAVAPDWVCEVLSPATAKLDRTAKLPVYAAHGVKHAWLVDPLLRGLEVMAVEQGRRVIVGSFDDGDKVRAAPFHAFELDLAVLWANVTLDG